MSIIASIIIPTHNRYASLKRMLENLIHQSFPLQNFEVVVAADGCKDGTVQLLKEHKSPLNLIVCELEGIGAGSARNHGASVARGKYLVFLDDDMEPSVDFLKEHIALHNDENTVVIGYSPLKLEANAGTHRMRLREWWEEKFQEMRNPRHRFKYSDLTSGNFSISLALFKKTKGFDTRLLCREDYEFGFRLLDSGASFHFAYRAKAYHCDQVTDLKRSMQRKRLEGFADILIKKIHPDFINYEAMYYLSRRARTKSIILKAIQYAPSLCNILANLGIAIMNFFEKLTIRTPWWTINNYLHQYWYLKGLIQAAKSVKELQHLIYDKRASTAAEGKLRIDLERGLKKAEEDIDRIHPLSLDIYYGSDFLGSIYYQSGFESLKGKHLRKILKDHFSEKLLVAIYPEKIFRQGV